MDKLRIEERDAGVRLVILTDPDKRNAMGDKMAASLQSAVATLSADEDVRAVIFTGQGSAFCAGADLPAMFSHPERPVADTHTYLQGYYRAFLRIRDLPVPTIAAVNGPAIGAGLNLALACDLRIAGTGAQFGATFARIGLHPGGGCTWFLVQALGPGRALRTLLLGDTLDAETAVRWGLAEGPEEDPVDAATALAGRFAALPPGLSRHIKQAVRIATETGDFDATLQYESWAQAASAASPVLQEWVERFRS